MNLTARRVLNRSYVVATTAFCVLFAACAASVATPAPPKETVQYFTVETTTTTTPVVIATSPPVTRTVAPAGRPSRPRPTTTTTAQVRNAGESPCPDGNWRPAC